MAERESPYHIVIAEDSATQAMRLRLLLEEQGYRVSVGRDGQQALKLVHAEAPNLVISDIVMPNMTGYDLCHAIKQDATLYRIPVVLMTTLSDVKDVIDGLRAQADFFMTKPVDDDYLLTQVAHLVANPPPLVDSEEDGGLEVKVAGHRFTVTSSRQQILNLLLSTYENAVRQNRLLTEIQAEVEGVNRHLKSTLGELKRSNEELEQFASVASHDLQAPLRSITGYLGILKQECADVLPDESRTFLDSALANAGRMSELIRDLLAYARVGSRHEPCDVDAGRALATALENLEVPIAEAGAEVVADDLPVVRVDETQLVQLFQNLIGNAIKFQGDAPPRVRVSVERAAREWRFHVADNGIGIDEHHLAKVFEVFQRLHAPGRYPGTGIGLSICKKIVERHGGHISLTSVVGEGTTFAFTLPA